MIAELPLWFDPRLILDEVGPFVRGFDSARGVAVLAVESGDGYEFAAGFDKPYTVGVVKKVAKYFPITRVRLVRLLTGACYQWHKDKDHYRVHIALETNPGCFLVSEGEAPERMPEEGRAYLFRSNVMHTAFNGGGSDRTHLLFNTK